jgi:hypothetical protein
MRLRYTAQARGHVASIFSWMNSTTAKIATITLAAPRGLR